MVHGASMEVMAFMEAMESLELRNPWIPWIRVHGLPGIHADHDRLK